jgi:hypothetical protein
MLWRQGWLGRLLVRYRIRPLSPEIRTRRRQVSL